MKTGFSSPQVIDACLLDQLTVYLLHQTPLWRCKASSKPTQFTAILRLKDDNGVDFIACARAHYWLLARVKTVHNLLWTLKCFVQHSFRLHSQISVYLRFLTLRYGYGSQEHLYFECRVLSCFLNWLLCLVQSIDAPVTLDVSSRNIM